MRLRLARKIYFPRDVGPAYRATTIKRAFKRLSLGNGSRWRSLRPVYYVSYTIVESSR